jgi:transforming growth factor-beta-induced protein
MNTTWNTKRTLAMSAAVLSLTLAACGSDKAAETPATTAAPTATPAATNAPKDSAPAAAGLSAMNFGPGCAAVPADGKGSFEGMAVDPAATAASNNPALSTLVAAVGAAELVDTLNGPGPFTIFAPANSAFEKIDKATIDALLADPKGDLTKILTLHVVAGESLSAQQLMDQGSVTTVNGEMLKITGSGDTISVNGSSAVVCGNVKTANATVHIIDTVLLPTAAEPPTTNAPKGTDAPTTVGLAAPNFGPGCAAVPADGSGSFEGMAVDPAATAASNNPALSTLVAAVSAAGLVDTLNGPGPFTIFAPANSAFEKIDKATIDALLADPTGDLTKILTLHVVAGESLSAEQLLAKGTVATVNGGELKITGSGDTISVNGSSAVVCGNVTTANATVHIIDTVLLP